MTFFPFIILLCIVYALDRSGSAAAYITAAAVHEAGHIAAIIASGGKISGIKQIAVGGSINYSSKRLSRKAEAFVYSSGIFFGALFAVLCRACGMMKYYDASAALTVMNILPAYPLDGGYILENLLPIDYSAKITGAVSVVTGICLCAAGLYLMINKHSFSLFFAGVTIFVCLIGKRGV